MKTKLFFLYIVLYTGLIYSQWELRYPDIPPDFINDIVFLDEQNGFAVNNGGSVLKTADGGLSWIIASQFQRDIFTKIKFINERNGFAISPHSFIGDSISFIKTTNGGNDWHSVDIYMGIALDFLPLSGDEFLKSNQVSVAFLDYSIERYNKSSGNWIIVYDIPHFYCIDVWSAYGDILQFQRLSNKIIALGSSFVARNCGEITDSVSFILESYDEGYNWDTLWCALPYASSSIYFLNDSIGWMGFEYDKIYKTTDGGLTWVEKYSESLPELSIKSIFATNENNIYTINQQSKVVYSNDGGNTWQSIVLNNIYDDSPKIYFLNQSRGFIAGSDFWITNDGGNSWNRVSNSLKGKFYKVDFIDELNGMGVGDKVYKTNDGGYNWYPVKESSGDFTGLDMIDSSLAWVVHRDSLYKTTDAGLSWSGSSPHANIEYMRGIAFFSQNLGIIYDAHEEMIDTALSYVTTDGGNTWERYPIGNLPFLTSYFKMKFTDPYHLWFVNQQGVWLSRDTAKTWEYTDINGTVSGAFDFADSIYGWFATSGGLQDKYKFTEDGGLNWQVVNKPYSNQSFDLVIYKNETGQNCVLSVGVEGSSFSYIGETSPGIVNDTYTQNNLYNIATYATNHTLDLWIAGDNLTLLHSKIFITGIQSSDIEPILSYQLLQNYPNPFNTITSISYQMLQTGLVTLKVYDILGKEVATLVNEQKNQGRYSVNFSAGGGSARGGDASRLASGVYIYQIRVNDYVSSKKMLLLK